MASTRVYTSDKELEDLYNSLEKGSLVRMLIEKHKQLEKQVKNLTIPVVVGQREQFYCVADKIGAAGDCKSQCESCENTGKKQ